MDNLFTHAYMPFSVAILVMFGIGALEAIGLGFSALDLDFDHDFGHDLDHDLNADHDLLGLLGIGHVPLMAVMVSLLTLFGLLGILGQNIAEALLGAPIRLLFMVPAVIVVTLPLTGILSRQLGRIMPQEETTAIADQQLIGKRATIILGTAQKGNPTKAKVIDVYNRTHYVMVEPDYDEAAEGDELLLVRKENGVFIGTSPQPRIMTSIEG